MYTTYRYNPCIGDVGATLFLEDEVCLDYFPESIYEMHAHGVTVINYVPILFLLLFLLLNFFLFFWEYY